MKLTFDPTKIKTPQIMVEYFSRRMSIAVGIQENTASTYYWQLSDIILDSVGRQLGDINLLTEIRIRDMILKDQV